MDPERVADYRCHTGEGPLWHPIEKRLYWVDIPRGRLFRYDPATGEHERCHDGEEAIGGFTIQADGSLLLFTGGSAVRVWDDGIERTVREFPGESDTRFNDVIADPLGGVFCGTMPTAERSGSLYRLGTDGAITEIEASVGLPNGMGFTPALDRLYFTDSEAGRIDRYEYDRETGAVGNRETFVDVSDEAGIPDGMTVDAEGHVWSARWDGGCLVRYAPDGTEERRIEFPARKVSSVVFGGRAYRDAYVTTALGPGEGEAGTRDEEGEGAGALFRITPGVGGLEEFFSRVGL